MSSLEPHFEYVIDNVLKGEYREPPATWVDYICLGVCLGASKANPHHFNGGIQP